MRELGKEGGERRGGEGRKQEEEGGSGITNIRIKEEVFVSNETVEHSESLHQLTWSELYPTTQLWCQHEQCVSQCVYVLLTVSSKY